MKESRRVCLEAINNILGNHGIHDKMSDFLQRCLPIIIASTNDMDDECAMLAVQILTLMAKYSETLHCNITER
jgi:hypothetical protein